ncbi:hypothetical protein EXIGLDRAFT_835739 [Exidia glandulosa HHB12029]|uniref:Uncharacterized protein n=1 Tax=Exidia glandulosa HHB12029 TaxID=1314781 RepID=A0A165IIE8_EXIGL|nr:hypothetical protein EXIGLDRAFT_835739 [Exidia glandulosa HHB12029]
MHRPRPSTPSRLSLKRPITMSTPALSSPSAFSSPVDTYDRCDTPSSPTPHATRPALQFYTGSSSSPAWPVKSLPSHSKMDVDIDPDATDDEDERATPMLTDADTMSEWTDAHTDDDAASVASVYDDDTLAAAEVVLMFSRAPRLQLQLAQPQPKSEPEPAAIAPVTLIHEPQPQPESDPIPDCDPALAVEPLIAPVPVPSTPARLSPPREKTDDIELGDLSDLTPIKPSPPRAKKPRAQLKKRASSSKTARDSDDDDDVLFGSAKPAPTPAPKRAPKRKSNAVSTSDQHPAKKRASGSGASPRKRVAAGPPEILGVDAATVTELEGFLVETLALAKSTSISTTQLVAAVLAEQSHLRPQRSEQEWADVFAQVLDACAVFGRIRRTVKDANGKPIEDQWYYQPDRDTNSERASLLGGLVKGKRSAAKKEDVQYYWRPIPKTRVVRW